jgi:hypothetical protein
MELRSVYDRRGDWTADVDRITELEGEVEYFKKESQRSER